MREIKQRIRASRDFASSLRAQKRVPTKLSLFLGLMSAMTSMAAAQPATGWTNFVSESFETGFGAFTDGGNDCALSSTFATDGSQCLQLRDDSSSSVATQTLDVDVSQYDELEISFNYTFRKMEVGESFHAELYDGSGWTAVGSYTLSQDSENEITNPITISLTTNDVAFATDSKLRFRCDASGNRDYVHIDEVLFRGYYAGPTNSAPVANSGGDVVNEDDSVAITLTATDADGDPLTYSIVSATVSGSLNLNGNIATYTPNSDFNGSDSFTFKANDGSTDSNTATVSITVTPMNDDPVASSDSGSVYENRSVDLVLAASDIDGDLLTFSVIGSASNGSVAINGNVATYTPFAGFYGSDSFTFNANDGTVDSNTASVALTVTEAGVPSNVNVQSSTWTVSGVGGATLVAASQVSGHYAVADRGTNSIEIRDIRETVLATIDHSDLLAILPGADLSGDYGPCSMTFSSQGRLLFIGVCNGAGSVATKDAILRYNLNTGDLDLFDDLRIAATMSTAMNYGMTFYKGELFVGTDSGLLRYPAGKNTFNSIPAETVVPSDSSMITGVAVDMMDETLYVSTPQSVYRSDLTAASLSLSSVASVSDIKDITMGRSFGSIATQGLHILSNDEQTNCSIHYIELDDLRDGGGDTLLLYTDAPAADWTDLSATACGRMMIADGQAWLMADASDTRLSFDDWVQDEFNEYSRALKTLMWQDGVVPEGFNTTKLTKLGDSLSNWIDVDTSGWAVYCLLTDYLVNGDTEAEGYIEKILERNAGAHSDGKGGLKTVDGIMHDRYDANGDVMVAEGTLYTHMKLLPSAYKAEEIFPNNTAFADYRVYFRDSLKRLSDSVNSNFRITWKNDNYGPAHTVNGSTNESWIMVDLAAAQDPLAASDYQNYLYDRSDIPDSEEYLIGEPVLKASHSAFIVLGATMILREHHEGASWIEEHNNYYATSMADGDDIGAPYFSAFSAGNNPNVSGNYYNDGPGDHPGNIIHFPAVCGFGQHWISPVVGAYLGYRDGLRQEMQGGTTYGNPKLLTRWSMDDPNYVMSAVGIADFWFGMVGLGKVLKPDLIDILADDYYMPNPTRRTGSLGEDVVEFSKITRRKVVAQEVPGGDWISMGFQRTPFHLDPGITYNDFGIEDPEGELIDVANWDFALGYTNWTKAGNHQFYQPDVDGISLVGKSVEIRTTGSTPNETSSISQVIDVSDDFDGTRYIVRVEAKSHFASPTGVAYLEAYWDGDDTNAVVSTEAISAINLRDELSLVAVKPTAASSLHIRMVARQDSPAYHRYLFDNVSVVRLGADVPQSNGDFESDFTDWVKLSGAYVSITEDANRVISGSKSVKIAMGAADVDVQAGVYRDIDISADADGTRYIFRLNVDTTLMDAKSDFNVRVECYDNTSAMIVPALNDVGDAVAGIDPDHDNHNPEIVFTMRKRPEYESFRIKIRFKKGSESVAEEVIIDDFRMDREYIEIP